jgi:hypothetical protein
MSVYLNVSHCVFYAGVIDSLLTYNEIACIVNVCTILSSNTYRPK